MTSVQEDMAATEQNIAFRIREATGLEAKNVSAGITLACFDVDFPVFLTCKDFDAEFAVLRKSYHLGLNENYEPGMQSAIASIKNVMGMLETRTLNVY